MKASAWWLREQRSRRPVLTTSLVALAAGVTAFVAGPALAGSLGVLASVVSLVLTADVTTRPWIDSPISPLADLIADSLAREPHCEPAWVSRRSRWTILAGKATCPPMPRRRTPLIQNDRCPSSTGLGTKSKEKTMTSATLNGNGQSRKNLSSQIDRLDGILDGLAEALNESVADAVRTWSARSSSRPLRSPSRKCLPAPICSVPRWPSTTRSPRRSAGRSGTC